jgi:predicted HD phosphohydrolase
MSEATTTDPAQHRRAAFHAMVDGTQEDWRVITDESVEFHHGLPDRVLAHLRLLEHGDGGFAVDRLEHSVQTATRAYRADRDDEYVLCALLHDIGDTLGCYNHADIGAAIIEPFVSPRNHWMVEHHGIFQAYYYFHHLGLDRDVRERFRGHEWFEHTAEFCAEFDQPAFDPGYDSLPLGHFEPLVRDLMAAPRRSLYRPA